MRLPIIENKRVFISPLDWGMGHASRCIPIIRELKQKNIVILGTTKINSFFFEKYFPELQQLTVPSYDIKYSKFLPLWLKLFLQWPKIQKVISSETKIVKNLIQTHNIDLIISDNRFGLHSKNIQSIFITHQLNIKAPFFSSFINKLNRKYIHSFSEVWVPDMIEKPFRLSGELSNSDKIKIPVKFIGPQSALYSADSITKDQKIDILILLSGIEPHRTILEKFLLKKCESLPQKMVLVRGSNKGPKISQTNIHVIDFAFGDELKKLIVNAETVICRSGYSTLMDLKILNKEKLILIPTPGQTEQIYLANLWREKFGAEVFEMKNLNNKFKIH